MKYMRIIFIFVGLVAVSATISQTLYAQVVPPPRATPATVKKQKPQPKPKPDGSVALLIRADMDCVITVDGEQLGKVKKGGIKKTRLSQGKHLVEANSLDGNYHWEKIVTFYDYSDQEIINTDLNSKKSEADSRKAQKRAEFERQRVLELERQRAVERQREERKERKVYLQNRVIALIEKFGNRTVYVDKKVGEDENMYTIQHQYKVTFETGKMILDYEKYAVHYFAIRKQAFYQSRGSYDHNKWVVRLDKHIEIDNSHGGTIWQESILEIEAESCTSYTNGPTDMTVIKDGRPQPRSLELAYQSKKRHETAGGRNILEWECNSIEQAKVRIVFRDPGNKMKFLSVQKSRDETKQALVELIELNMGR